MMMTTTMMMASRCPSMSIIIIATNIIIITASIIPPSLSLPALRHRTRREGAPEHSQHDLVSFDGEFLNSTVINTSIANNRSDEDDVGDDNDTDHVGDDDDDDLNLSTVNSKKKRYNSLKFTSETFDILKSLINEYIKHVGDDDDGDDHDHVFDCYRLMSVLVNEENMSGEQHDADDDDDDYDNDDDDVILDTNKTKMTFKLVVKRYKSMGHHHHHHRQQKQQLSGSHGNDRPIKFCLPRDRTTIHSNGNTEGNSTEKINYVNEDHIEANESDRLRMDSTIELDRTPSRSARTQTVVITTSSVVITAFFFTAVFLRIRNHVKRYRNSVRHKSAMRLHATKELHKKSKSRNFTKFLSILTTGSWGGDNSQSMDRLQQTQLQPVQSEIRNLKLYNSRSDVEELDDDVIYPDVDFQDGRFKDEFNTIRQQQQQQENKSVRFVLNSADDQRLPVLRSHSYNPVSLTTEEGVPGEGGRRWRPRDDNNKGHKKGDRRKFSFQGRQDHGRNDLMKMSRFKSNKSKREMLHRCLEQLNSSNFNEASYQ